MDFASTSKSACISDLPEDLRSVFVSLFSCGGLTSGRTSVPLQGSLSGRQKGAGESVYKDEDLLDMEANHEVRLTLPTASDKRDFLEQLEKDTAVLLLAIPYKSFGVGIHPAVSVDFPLLPPP